MTRYVKSNASVMRVGALSMVVVIGTAFTVMAADEAGLSLLNNKRREVLKAKADYDRTLAQLERERRQLKHALSQYEKLIETHRPRIAPLQMEPHDKTLSEADPSDRDALAVVAASYGKGERIIDVTETVREQLAAKGFVDVKLASLGVHDPAFGVGKELVVKMTSGEQSYTLTIPSSGRLELTNESK